MAFIPPDYNEGPSMNGQEWLSNPNFEYNFVSWFMKHGNSTVASIFPSIRDFSGFSINREDLLHFEEGDNLVVDDIIWDNRGPLIFTVVGTIYALALLIVGILWCAFKICSCCCCNKKSSGRKDRDGGNSTGKIVCTVFMGIWIIHFVFLVFLGFGMNGHVNGAVNSLADDLDDTLTDTDNYIRVTIQQLDAIFVQSYNIMMEHIVKDPDDEALSLLHRSMNESRTTESQLNEIQAQTATIIGALNGNFGKALDALESTDASSNSAKLETISAYFNELTTIQQQVDNIKNAIFSSKQFESANDFLNGIPRVNISRAIPDPTDPVWTRLQEVGDNLKRESDELTDAMNSVPVNETRDELRQTEDIVEDVKQYVSGTLWFVLVFLVAIILTLTLGTAAHWFKKPGLESLFLNSGMIGLFVSGFFFAVFCTLAFLLSGFGHIVCENIKDMENPLEVNSAPFSRIKMETRDVSYDVPQYDYIIQACKSSKSAYAAFKLDQVFNIDELRDLVNNITGSELSTTKTVSRQIIGSTLNSFKESLVDLSRELETLQEYYKSFNIKNDLDAFRNAYKIQSSIIKSKTEDLTGYLLILTDGKNHLSQEDPLAEIKFQITSYGDFAHYAVQEKVGQCEPLYNAVEATRRLFCYKVGLPLAGFWQMTFYLLILYIPIFITIVFLRNMH